MIFFTADQHFDHWPINSYCNRGFKTVEEMNSTLIEAWNSVVGPDDEVYHLGDFYLGGWKVCEFIAQLNGHICFLRNSWHHDRQWLSQMDPVCPPRSKSDKAVDILPPIWNLEFPEGGDGRFPKTIVLCHYPIARWDKSHYLSWHLFGHCHGRYQPGKVYTHTRRGPVRLNLSMDVGIDSVPIDGPIFSKVLWTPWSLDEIVSIMSYRQYYIEKERGDEDHNRDDR